ncbi:MAG: hypothetical protein K1X71_10595 [Pirellulales bacterium]|nr:hypothetical protein [Pirellulales bacterium]
MLEALQSLKKLAKPHLSWPFQARPGTMTFPMWLPEQRALLAEYARITGSVPLSLEWFTPEQARVTRELAAPVCVASSPYQRMRQAKLPATSIGGEFLADLADYRARLALVADLSVTHLVIDVEHWRAANEDAEALLEKYRWLDRLARDCLPAARIIYYERGAVQPNNAGDDGWLPADWHPPNAPGEINSCSLYFSEWGVNQEIYRRTVARSDGMPVACFVALGTNQRRGGAGWSGRYEPGGYDLATAWQVGLELNHPWAAERARRYPCSTTPLVVFWPGAFAPEYPSWGEQFVAYCKGAAGEKI